MIKLLKLIRFYATIQYCEKRSLKCMIHNNHNKIISLSCFFVVKNKFILIYIFSPFLSFSAHTEAVRNRGSHSVDLFLLSRNGICMYSLFEKKNVLSQDLFGFSQGLYWVYFLPFK